MRHSCEYCSNCLNTDDYFCTVKEKFRKSESAIRRENKCEDFEFCWVSVITGEDCKPRKKYKTRKEKEEKYTVCLI